MPRPGALHHPPGLLDRLHAVDRLLHLRVEVLETEAQPVDAGLGQRVELLGGRLARVDLDTDLAIRGEAEGAAEDRHQLAQVVRRQEGRRAAPPVDLHHLAAAGLEQRGGHLDLARQHGKITTSPGAVARDGHVAAAEEAAHVAEGDMDIERQWPVRLFTAARQDLAVLERTEVVGELRRRGIRGVAWAGAVVLDDHLPVESDRLPEVVHGT